MASYHLSVKTGGKGNAYPHAAYIAREDKYARKKNADLEHKEAGNMPAWAAHNPAEFWKAADTFERANGCTYREIEIALPRELNSEQRLALVRDFVQQELGARHAYQFAIHNPDAAIDGGEQPHAHIMFSERCSDGTDRDPPHYFKRANSKDPARGGAKKVRFGETPAERKDYLTGQRERWAELQNKHLERYQHTARVDARSLKMQGIDRAPECHLGAGRVRELDTAQLHAVIERREAERIAQVSRDERDSVIDVTTSLREALAERDARIRKPQFRPGPDSSPGRTSDVEKEPEKLTVQVDDALKEIDLQALINDSVAEFQGIHQEMLRQQAREHERVQAQDKAKSRQVEQQPKDPRLRQNDRDSNAPAPEQKKQKPDRGWSFSR